MVSFDGKSIEICLKMEERCKLELKSSYLKCFDEGSTTTNLINNILEKHKSLLDNIDFYNSQQDLYKRKVILESTKLNYQLFNKLFSINVELESFWKSCIEHSLKTIADQVLNFEACGDALSTSSEPIHRFTSSVTTGDPIKFKSEYAYDYKTISKENSLNPLVPSFIPSKSTMSMSISSSSINSQDWHDALSNTDFDVDLLNAKQKKIGAEYNSCNSGSSSSKLIETEIKPKDKFKRKYEKDKCEILNSVSHNNSPYKNSKDLSVTKEPLKQNCEEIPEHDGPNNTDSCLVLYVQDPSEFYITPLGSDTIILIGELLAEYAKTSRENYKNKFDAKQGIGNYCIAYSEEFKSWNRAHILDWKMTEPHTVNVQFVDHGEYATVPYTCLMPIPAMFCEIPKQAICCSLLNVIPDNKFGKWSKSAIKYFEDICFNNGEYVEIRMISVAKKCHRIGVDFLKDGEDITCAESLVLAGHARYIAENDQDRTSMKFMVEQIQHAQGLSGISAQDDVSKALDKFCDSRTETYDTLADAMLGYNAQDDLRLCKFTRPDGTCFKGAKCKLKHVMRRKGGITVDTEEVLVVPDNTFMPDVNDVLSVYITHFKTPSLLFGQIKHPSNRYGGVMEEMFKCMNKKQVINSLVKFDYPPAVGELVIAKNFDEQWYRAMVLENNAHESTQFTLVHVFFIDFGNVADVLLLNVRKMIPGFVFHPCQAFRFSISNIRSLSDYDPEDFKEFTLRHLYTSVNVRVKYAGDDFISGIITDAKGNDLGDELINNYFAEPYSRDVYPMQSSNILVH